MLSTEHEVTLLSFRDAPEAALPDPPDGVYASVETVYLSRWRSWMQSLLAVPSSTPIQIAYYQSGAYREAVDRLAPEHDLVLAHLIRTAPYADALDGVPTVLEMTDAISLNYERVREEGTRWGLKPLVYRLEVDRVRAFEREAAQRFDLVSLVSQVDRDFLAEQLPDGSHVAVYPNGVDVDAFRHVGPGGEAAVVFVGNMRTAQNQDACDHFIDAVLPRLREAVPEMQLRIVGASPDAVASRYRAVEGVDFVGRVDRIADAVEGVCAGVCPMRIGAGLQNKVLEYMAMGLPAVVSPMGLEGIDATPGEQVLVPDGPDAMADAILALYRDDALRDRIAREGRAFVRRHHRWDRILAPFLDDVRHVLAGRPVSA